MRTKILVVLGFILIFLPYKLFAGDPIYKLEIQKNNQIAQVTMIKTGEKLIEIKLSQKESPDEEPAAHLEDFNFDGYPDLVVFGNAGNVQVFYDVYLYDPVQKKFLLNKKLSLLPCVESQPATKTVLSSCNHSSACENWSETYSWQKKKLTLIAREGTKCSSKDGCYYEYSEVLKNNKFVTITKKLICE